MLALENFPGMFGKTESGLVVDIEGGMGAGLSKLFDWSSNWAIAVIRPGKPTSTR